MSILKQTVWLLALLAVTSLVLGQTSQGGSHTSQGGPHQNQGRVRRQAEQDAVNNGINVNWTTCDLTTTPKYSCQDCNTRLICLPIGGKTISCPSINKPYCVDGFCSATPSAECA